MPISRPGPLIAALVLPVAVACGSPEDGSSEDATGGGDPTGAPPPSGSDPGAPPASTGDPGAPPASTGDPVAPPASTSDPGLPPAATGDPISPPAPTAGCNIVSGFAGDDRCILPPDPAAGFQIHAGPAVYDDPAAVAPFLLGPGDETVECYYTKTGNDAEVFYRSRQYRMRPGSHHMIIKTSDTPREDGWGPCPPGLGGAVGGTQRGIQDPPDVVAPEDVGFGSRLAAHRQLAVELHFVNSGDQPILREAWVNWFYKDPSEVTQVLSGVAMIGGLGMNVLPGTTELVNNSCQNDQDGRRIVSLTGHVHAHTERFTVWAHRAGQRQLVYEMYDWEDPADISYNSVTQNPEPDRATLTAGGISGLFTLNAGDSLEWECEVVNDGGVALRFANEVYTAEMCNLFGSTPETSLSCFK